MEVLEQVRKALLMQVLEMVDHIPGVMAIMPCRAPDPVAVVVPTQELVRWFRCPGIVVIRYQIAQLAASAKATGGEISFYNAGSGLRVIHAFTTSGSLVTPASFSETVEYVVIAGGGGGGYNVGGGGGAGAYFTGTTPIGSSQTVPISIGGGGRGGQNPGDSSGVNGSNTTTPWVTAHGGGRDGNPPDLY